MQIMYWPDYSSRNRRKRSLWIVILLLGLFIGVILGGSMNGWWGFLTPADDFQAAAAVYSKLPSDMSLDIANSTPKSAVSAAPRPSVAWAPNFVLPGLFEDSLEHALTDYAGRPVILNFWASWCVPCRIEMPALQRAYEEHRDSGLVVLGVNQTYMDNPVAARDFVDELALTFPNVRDDTGNISEALYQVMGLPTSLFITAGGEIAHRQIGQMTDVQIENFSRQLTTGEASTP
jgi:thiol-disulfide isomerase/thioredoxin